MLVHYSNYKIENINTNNQEFCENMFTPCGIWFAEDKLYKKYINLQFGKKSSDFSYKYKIKVLYTNIDIIDTNKVLLIDNNKIFNKFLIYYGYISKNPDMLAVEWIKVAKNFGGIYFSNICKYKVMPKTLKHFDYKINKNFVVYEDILINGKFEYIPTSSQVFSYTLHFDSGCIWSKKPVIYFEKYKKTLI
jgi:hypothetical protein